MEEHICVCVCEREREREREIQGVRGRRVLVIRCWRNNKVVGKKQIKIKVGAVGLGMVRKVREKRSIGLGERERERVIRGGMF